MTAITEEIKTFELTGKVVAINTDNGSNVKKAVLSMQDEAQEKENVRRTERRAEKAKRSAQEKEEPAKKKKENGYCYTLMNHTIETIKYLIY